MAYTNFIAAIDLGSSNIVGMIGTKNAAGALTIIAYEAVSSVRCIRRGCIYNVDEAAFQIKNLVQKLNNKIPGERVDKVYIGIGGQSIRSIEHVITRTMSVEGAVTADIIKSMDEECRRYKPEMLDVLDIVSPTFYLDGKKENNPVGVACSRIEAHYKLIVGRPSLRRNIVDSIKERAKIDIAGIFVSPLAVADAILFDGEKDLGCALISFGAGVTSLSVYKNNELASLCVIPLGGNLITRDIMTLNVVQPEAERIKKSYGSVIIDKENDSAVPVSAAEGVGPRQIKLNELNMVVEARMQEIVENVYARLEETGLMKSLGAGIIITGGAASLKNLDVVLKEKFENDVRIATIKKGLIEKSMLNFTEPEYVAIGLLMKGEKNCAYVSPVRVVLNPPKEPTGNGTAQNKESTEEVEGEQKTGRTSDMNKDAGTRNNQEEMKGSEPGNKLFDKIAKKFGGLLFDDDEMGQKKQDKKKH